MENDIKVWAIQIKGKEQDAAFGFNKYVWATDKQVKTIMEKQESEDHWNDLIMLGGAVFRLSQISQMRKVRIDEAKNWASFDPKITAKAVAELENSTYKQDARYIDGKAKLLDQWSMKNLK